LTTAIPTSLGGPTPTTTSVRPERRTQRRRTTPRTYRASSTPSTRHTSARFTPATMAARAAADTGYAVHSARPSQSYTTGGVTYTGETDTGTTGYPAGRRYLPSYVAVETFGRCLRLHRQPTAGRQRNVLYDRKSRDATDHRAQPGPHQLRPHGDALRPAPASSSPLDIATTSPEPTWTARSSCSSRAWPTTRS
jgi:hypothetical protein